MNRLVQVTGIALLTVALFFLARPAVARGLRLDGPKAQLAAIGLRFFLTIFLVLGLVTSEMEHRVALVFTVGAAYFAAAMIQGCRRFRRRETNG